MPSGWSEAKRIAIRGKLDIEEERLGLVLDNDDEAEIEQLLERLMMQQREYHDRLSSEHINFRSSKRTIDPEPLARPYYDLKATHDHDRKLTEIIEKLATGLDVEALNIHRNASLMDNVGKQDPGTMKDAIVGELETVLDGVVEKAYPRLVTSVIQFEQRFQKLAKKLQETRMIVRIRGKTEDALSAYMKHEDEKASKIAS